MFQISDECFTRIEATDCQLKHWLNMGFHNLMLIKKKLHTFKSFTFIRISAVLCFYWNYYCVLLLLAVAMTNNCAFLIWPVFKVTFCEWKKCWTDCGKSQVLLLPLTCLLTLVKLPNSSALFKKSRIGLSLRSLSSQSMWLY